ncbi:hypothetical protein GBA52_021565 [Prunus armeniaca]|nr:hypothetical protein GBA52_021565 [Prunus armeniaca]
MVKIPTQCDDVILISTSRWINTARYNTSARHHLQHNNRGPSLHVDCDLVSGEGLTSFNYYTRFNALELMYDDLFEVKIYVQMEV